MIREQWLAIKLGNEGRDIRIYCPVVLSVGFDLPENQNPLKPLAKVGAIGENRKAKEAKKMGMNKMYFAEPTS